MVFVYGVHVFTKNLGYFGNIEECPHCHRAYKKELVRAKKWAHFDYIPIFPVGSSYTLTCPICGAGKELKKQQAKDIMNGPTDPRQQSIQAYGKHVLAKKPQKALKTDRSFELWTRDMLTGEDLCIKTDLTRDQLKQEKKKRGLKEFTIIDA